MKNTTVLVTGGSKGIGREIAGRFLKRGNEVVIADREAPADVASYCESGVENGRLTFIRTDISKPDDITRLFREISGLFGGLDILVNNAGFGIWKMPGDLTVGEWDSVIDTNLRGTFLCSREAITLMKSRGGGYIINIASTRAFMSEPGSEAYAASKGGIIALTHALAASLAPYGIRVNSISPGWIETGDYGSLRERDHSQHFSGRVGRPSDIAAACVFLAENDFINGANLTIDGGMTRKMIYEPD